MKHIVGRIRRVIRLSAVFCLFLFAGIGLWCVFTPKPPLLEGIPFSTVVLDRQGALMRLSLAEDQRYRVYAALEDIAPELVEATLLYEDKYFYRHPGVNLFALFRAAFSTYLESGRRMGASTITMQLARLRLNLNTGSVPGKLRQIERALAYELHYSKREILEAYLNLAPYGGNIEGCGAASRIYYHKDPKHLHLAESLSLVGVPQNPTRRNPLTLTRLEADTDLQKVRNRLFALWLDRHPEDAGQHFLLKTPLEVFAPADLPFAAPHMSTEAIARYGGKTVRTTLDSRLQRRVERQIQAMVERNAPLGVHNACALILHWPSMEVRALVGSADFFNPEIEGQVDGTRARRSPGSTLKPFIYALALDQGIIHPRTLLYDSPRNFSGYDPENMDQAFRGPLSATEALRSSRNIPAIALANRLGRNQAGDPRIDSQTGSEAGLDLYAFLRTAGVKFDYGRDHYGLALVLGGAETTMRELAALYALLANRGVFRAPALFEEDKNEAGQRLISPEACVLTLRMLRGLPAGARINGAASSQVALYGKTGTSNGFRDAWTAGIFGPYVLVVWTGNFDNTPNRVFTGARLAAPLFLNIAETILSTEKLEDLPMRRQEDLNLAQVKVCSDTGDLNNKLCPHLTETWFIPGVSPIEDSGVYRQILLDPESGLRACVDIPGRTQWITWEFWPTDLRQIFHSAGIMKPAPPPFMPECGITENHGGRSPEILSPKTGMVYHRSLNRPEGALVTLHAAGDADVTDFFWFADNRFIGRGKPDEHLSWVPPGGSTLLRVVDNFGRSGQRTVVVELTD